MNKISIFLLSTFLTYSSISSEGARKDISHLKWDNLEVVWLKDERFPVYGMAIYFADGALSDGAAKGATELAFDLLPHGTRRYSQKEILDNLEFFGSNFSSNITHEYSTYLVQGQTKYIDQTLWQICHLFRDATYPETELKKAKQRLVNGLQGMVKNHRAVARRAMRRLSLAGTPFQHPIDGGVKGIKRLKRKDLIKSMKYFNDDVKKRIYLVGPSSILPKVKKVINQDCGWKGNASFVRKAKYPRKRKDTKRLIHLVTVPHANQAQIQIGRFINKGEYENPVSIGMATHFLGGGFTSKLMRELRVNKGLTYGVGAFAGEQWMYARSGIGTSTKSKTVVEAIEVIEQVVADQVAGKFDTTEFERQRGSYAGSFPFQFENTKSFLMQLMSLDHQRKSYDKLFNFPTLVRNLKKADIIRSYKDIFLWDKQTILVVGDKSLKKQLSRYGRVKVSSYKDFL